jgi:hypothetical protein
MKEGKYICNIAYHYFLKVGLVVLEYDTGPSLREFWILTWSCVCILFCSQAEAFTFGKDKTLA